MIMIDKKADQYKRTGKEKYRKEVVDLAEPIIQSILNKANIPETVVGTYEDIRQEAYIAVLETLERYDHTRPSRYSTFMYVRVWGTVRSYLRSHDTLSRRDRKKIGEVKGMVHEIEQEKGYTPSLQELSDRTGMDIDKLTMLEHSRVRDDVEDHKNLMQCDSYDDTLRKERREWLINKMRPLPVRDKTILICTFFLDMDGRETADLLDFSDRRYVYQLKYKLLDYLK